MIAGLEHNDAGRIWIGDRLVSDAARGTFVPPERRQIGMVFQSYAIWPHMTVFANVAYPLEVRGSDRARIRERVLATLRLVELDHLAERPATALSGGQQQRVAIARALVFEPAVLLMDEPLSNLDARLREQMRVDLRALQQRLAITTVYVTHDQEEAMVISDLIAVMDAGRVRQIAGPEEIYLRPATRAVAAFFGMPNLLDAKVREVERRDATGAVIRVDGTGWEGSVSAAPDVASGDAVIVLVRPEAVQVGRAAPAGADAGIAWSGRVRQSYFRGSRRMMTVAASGLVLNVDAPPDVEANVGDSVWLRVDVTRAWALRE
jgi:iron(III) transport system ATP-binding protein